ncbi:MAG: hypothetical protein JWM68_655 [Verrucomicrobiales bacterium]|nr:hypothetical protein [Verrucomicrobiales bacterium]
MPVSLSNPSFYACWREQNSTAVFLREGQSAPQEKLLQAIWHHQRLLRSQLKTEDGREIRVLHPGFWNREAGPDFRGAVLRIGDQTTTGDIEIDLHSSGWRGHGHDTNPNFRNIILHVVWEPGVPQSDLPVLRMKDVLDSPLSELALWLGSDASKSWPSELSGNCCAPLRDLPEEKLRDLLHQAATVRLQRKAHELQSRARQVGWEQSLWEGLFRALGYKHNVWPMQRLAELLPQILKGEPTVLDLQARLLGVGGLLPDDISRKSTSTDKYLRQIWDIWWRERESFGEVILPRSIWRFHSLRPANHPQRRLALAAHCLMDKENFFSRLEKWFVSDVSEKLMFAELREIFPTVSDDFWEHHWTLRSAPLAKPQPLIGDKRITDLAINVILPWFWIRAVAGKNLKLQQIAERRYFAWPAAEDNSVLKLARQRLLGGSKSKVAHTSALQQGLMQVVRDFCEHSNAVCENCQFPALVRQIK